MLSFFGKIEKQQEQKPLQEVTVSDAIGRTLNTSKVERAVLAYVSLQEQIKFGGISSQDAPELNKSIDAIFEALSDSGIVLEDVHTQYGVDNKLHLFVEGYMAALP